MKSWRRSRAGAAISRRLQRWPARNYFAELEPASKVGHPVDDLMARDPEIRRIQRRSLRHLQRLQARPGSDALLDFEAERNHLDSARVEAAYNIGFENGLIAGRADGLRRRSGRRRGSEEQALRRDLRVTIGAANTSPNAAQALLLELAWALSLGALARSS